MIKLEKSLVHNSRVSKLGGNCAYLRLWRFWDFYSSVEPKSMPWSRSSFLIGENLFNPCIFRNPFLVGVFLIRGKHEAQDISLYTHAWRPSKATSDSPKIHISPSTYSLQLILFSLLSSAYYLQLIAFSLLSPTYCLQPTIFNLLSLTYYLQLTVPKMQPSGMGWSCRLYNKVVSYKWSWQPCYVHRLLFRHGLITKLPLSTAPYSIASSALADGLWS